MAIQWRILSHYAYGIQWTTRQEMHISLGNKKHSVKSVQEFEDTLTSMFFGTLRYLHPRLVAKFFQSLLGQKTETIREALVTISRDEVIAEFDFWQNFAQFGRVEPDLLVRLRSPDGDFVQLLIEWKCEADETSYRAGPEGRVAHGRRTRAPTNSQHGGSHDPGLLRAKRRHDPRAGRPVPRGPKAGRRRPTGRALARVSTRN